MGISVVQLAKLNVGGGGATANLDQNEANMYSLWRELNGFIRFVCIKANLYILNMKIIGKEVNIRYTQYFILFFSRSDYFWEKIKHIARSHMPILQPRSWKKLARKLGH
jgi:hypothetical protein